MKVTIYHIQSGITLEKSYQATSILDALGKFYTDVQNPYVVGAISDDNFGDIAPKVIGNYYGDNKADVQKFIIE